MSIDPFTFVAQILNFILLVWLLKRFLYGPIMTAMEQREAEIADSRSAADAARNLAEESEREYRRQLEELAGTRGELLAEAGREADASRTELLRQAKDEVEIARVQWQQSLDRDKQSFVRELQLTTTRQATELSRHVLRQLSDQTIQQSLIRKFCELLKASDEKDAVFTSDLKQQPIAVETSHELNDHDRQKLIDAIRDSAGREISLEFRVNPRLVCGIELRGPGRKLAWSVRQCVEDLENELVQSVEMSIPRTSHSPSDPVISRQASEVTVE